MASLSGIWALFTTDKTTSGLGTKVSETLQSSQESQVGSHPFLLKLGAGS